MSCCGLSSTGLNNIDANELTSDNITVFSNLNVSGYSFLNNVLINNNTSLLSSLNVSGYTTLNNSVSLLSALNISGRTIIGTDIYDYGDSLFEVNKNMVIRNSNTSGSRIDISVGLGSGRSYMSLEQYRDINLFTPSGGTVTTTIGISSDQSVINSANHMPII